MSKVIYFEDDRVAGFVASGLDGMQAVEDFGKFVTIGVEVDGEVAAGAVFNNMRSSRGVPYDVSISFYASDPSWATKEHMQVILDYPFKQLGVKRITALCRKANKKVRKLLEALGFQYEGKARLGWDGIYDAFIYGMTARDAENTITSLKESRNGKRRRLTTTGP